MLCVGAGHKFEMTAKTVSDQRKRHREAIVAPMPRMADRDQKRRGRKPRAKPIRI
jgi:hypothetical protein